MYQEWARTAGIQLLVAGGLHVDNVDELVDAYAPDGVDVSSSVETDGVKDSAKITAFVERVTRK
ncbi:N-(5'-phosphoribosyl)anthranilate isomerase [compost metagenome]